MNIQTKNSERINTSSKRTTSIPAIITSMRIRYVTKMALFSYVLLLLGALLILSSSSSNNYSTKGMLIVTASTPNEDSKENEKVEIEQQQQQQTYDTTDKELGEVLDDTGGETTSLIVIGILFVLTWVYLSVSGSNSKGDKNKKERDLKRKQELFDRTNQLFDSMSYSTTRRNSVNERISSKKHNTIPHTKSNSQQLDNNNTNANANTNTNTNTNNNNNNNNKTKLTRNSELKAFALLICRTNCAVLIIYLILGSARRALLS